MLFIVFPSKLNLRSCSTLMAGRDHLGNLGERQPGRHSCPGRWGHTAPPHRTPSPPPTWPALQVWQLGDICGQWRTQLNLPQTKEDITVRGEKAIWTPAPADQWVGRDNCCLCWRTEQCCSPVWPARVPGPARPPLPAPQSARGPERSHRRPG